MPHSISGPPVGSGFQFRFRARCFLPKFRNSKMKLQFQFLICVIFAISPQAAHSEVSTTVAESLIANIISSFSAEIESTHHLPLDVRYSWSIDTFQALGGRLENTVEFTFYGGLLTGEMDEDTLKVVVCHELGHVLGGYPEVPDYPYPKNSVEGQADYFATAKCLKRVFANDDNQALMQRVELPRSITTPCGQVYHDSERDIALCQRSLWAAVRAFQFMYRDPGLSFDVPEATVAHETSTSYPAPQCRLDSLKAGALCPISDLIGFSFSDPSAGACRAQVAEEALGARPRCWFKE